MPTEFMEVRTLEDGPLVTRLAVRYVPPVQCDHFGYLEPTVADEFHPAQCAHCGERLTCDQLQALARFSPP